MDTTVTAASLQGIALFAGLNESELSEVLVHSDVVQCAAESVIVSQGESERTLYVILAGSAQVVLHVTHVGDEVIAELPTQSTFGEASFFHTAPHAATVRAVTPVTLLRLQRAKFDELRKEDNLAALKIGCNAASLLAERLQLTDAWLAEQMTSLQDRRIHDSWARFRERVSRPTFISGGFTVGG